MTAMLDERPRQQLKYIITQFGRSVCDEPKRCEALLRDLCPQHKREMNLLILALKEQVAQELLKHNASVPIELTLTRLEKRLHDNVGIAEHFATWAVESWALALGVIQQPRPIKASSSSKPESFKSGSQPTPHCSSRPEGFTCPKTGMEFIYVEAGSFMMGSPESEPERLDWEKQHRVEIKQGFYLGKYLVTQKQWQQVMGDNPSYFKGDDLPVEQVSFEDIEIFINRLNMDNHTEHNRFCLPTEAQWEYACRAGTTTPFYTQRGNCINTQLANYDGNHDYNGCGAKTGEYKGKTTPVGSYPPSPWGFYDMAGNVWEWTASEWDSDYSGKELKVANGNGARAVRGGSWINLPWRLRSACRCGYDVDIRGYGLGLRLARM